MVEGPGCTLNGEKIRARVRPGQAVTGVRGRALQSLVGPALPPAASQVEVSSQVSQSYEVECEQKHPVSGSHGICIYFGPGVLGPVFLSIYR